MRQRLDAQPDQVEAYEGLGRELGAKPTEVALASLLRNLAVSMAVVLHHRQGAPPRALWGAPRYSPYRASSIV
jgi:hypothetical protein